MTDQDLILRYIDETLPAEDREKLEKRLAQEPVLRQMLDETGQVVQAIENTEDEAPPTTLQSAFMDALAKEFPAPDRPASPATVHPVGPYWRTIAATILLVLGVSLGIFYQLNHQQKKQMEVLAKRIQQTQHLLALSMLEQPSAAQRIKAVNTIQKEIKQPDSQVVSALLERMRTDPHVNVRMRAVEALVQFAQAPQVIPALTRQLEREEHPQVLLSLIDALVILEAQPAAPALKELLKSDTQSEVVRNRAAYGMGQLL